jgi:hypothetical protein
MWNQLIGLSCPMPKLFKSYKPLTMNNLRYLIFRDTYGSNGKHKVIHSPAETFIRIEQTLKEQFSFL